MYSSTTHTSSQTSWSCNPNQCCKFSLFHKLLNTTFHKFTLEEEWLRHHVCWQASQCISDYPVWGLLLPPLNVVAPNLCPKTKQPIHFKSSHMRWSMPHSNLTCYNCAEHSLWYYKSGMHKARFEAPRPTCKNPKQLHNNGLDVMGEISHRCWSHK